MLAGMNIGRRAIDGRKLAIIPSIPTIAVPHTGARNMRQDSTNMKHPNANIPQYHMSLALSHINTGTSINIIRIWCPASNALPTIRNCIPTLWSDIFIFGKANLRVGITILMESFAFLKRYAVRNMRVQRKIPAVWFSKYSFFLRTLEMYDTLWSHAPSIASTILDISDTSGMLSNSTFPTVMNPRPINQRIGNSSKKIAKLAPFIPKNMKSGIDIRVGRLRKMAMRNSRMFQNSFLESWKSIHSSFHRSQIDFPKDLIWLDIDVYGECWDIEYWGTKEFEIVIGARVSILFGYLSWFPAMRTLVVVSEETFVKCHGSFLSASRTIETAGFRGLFLGYHKWETYKINMNGDMGMNCEYRFNLWLGIWIWAVIELWMWIQGAYEPVYLIGCITLGLLATSHADMKFMNMIIINQITVKEEDIHAIPQKINSMKNVSKSLFTMVTRIGRGGMKKYRKKSG